MIAGEGTEVIRRSAREIYEFVLDPERYKQADLKIGEVYSLRWLDDRSAEIHYSGRFRGWTTPAVRQVITVEPYRRIDVRSNPGTLAHRLSCFHGVFTFDEVGPAGTRVYHREELVFSRGVRWLIEPLLRAWLERDTPEEMRRLKALLEE